MADMLYRVCEKPFSFSPSFSLGLGATSFRNRFQRFIDLLMIG